MVSQTRQGCQGCGTVNVVLITSACIASSLISGTVVASLILRRPWRGVRPHTPKAWQQPYVLPSVGSGVPAGWSEEDTPDGLLSFDGHLNHEQWQAIQERARKPVIWKEKAVSKNKAAPWAPAVSPEEVHAVHKAYMQEYMCKRRQKQKETK